MAHHYVVINSELKSGQSGASVIKGQGDFAPAIFILEDLLIAGCHYSQHTFGW